MTESACKYTISLAKRVAEGSSKIIKDADLPWCVTRLGCRIEYGFRPAPPKNGADFDEVHEVNTELGKLFHIYTVTHGVLFLLKPLKEHLKNRKILPKVSRNDP